jgi:hypothetical protein
MYTWGSRRRVEAVEGLLRKKCSSTEAILRLARGR